MKNIFKRLYTMLNTFISLYSGVQHGHKVKCNFRCKFTSNTRIGNNCHFNGMKISGNGNVIIGDNFHSGKNIRILTTFHNFDKGTALPYDNTSYDRDVIIEDNVWLGEAVMILGGVTIGEGAVIQAGSVVCKDVPPLAIAGGHPAVPFKYRDEEHYYRLKNEGRFM
ncbi:MAG: acyltransferase [Lachnospiraceae bacterium]|nr:acyltransferase [Lachnospiraceae bacterium]